MRMSGGVLQHPPALVGGRVAGAHADRELRLEPGERAPQVPLDVVVERLERRDVEQPEPCARARVQPVDPGEEGRERLPGAGRRLDEHVPAARDRGPAEPLRGRGLLEHALEPGTRRRREDVERLHAARVTTAARREFLRRTLATSQSTSVRSYTGDSVSSGSVSSCSASGMTTISTSSPRACSPRLDALGDRRPGVRLAEERERRHPDLREHRPRVEVQLLDPERAALLVEQHRREEQETEPLLVERREQVGAELVLVLAPDAVHVVVEAPPQIERARDDVLPVAGEAQLLSGRVHHLLARRDSGRGDEDEERHAVGGGRGQRRDPAALAVAPEPDPLDADRVQHRERVAHLHVEAAAGRVARRLALAAAVEGDDADARGRKSSVQVLVEHPVARPLAARREARRPPSPPPASSSRRA